MAELVKTKEDIFPAAERFSRYMLAVQGRSPKTIAEYMLDLHSFFAYLLTVREKGSVEGTELSEVVVAYVDDEMVKSVKTVDVLEFLVYTATEKHNSAASRARKLSAIRSFYKYIVTKEGLMEKNPAADIETPKKRTSLPKYLSKEESVSLLKSVLADERSKTKERDFCIITLFLNCGMRLSELCGISLSDLDRELRSLRVVGKGNKERIVYLNDACRDALSAYLLCRARDMKEIKDKNALFLSSQKKRISNKTVQWLVYKYLGAAGLEYKHFSTHKLRHTAATLMYQEGGVDVLALKEILGHSELGTTQIYTHIHDSALEDAVRRNPLSGLSAKELSKKDDDEE